MGEEQPVWMIYPTFLVSSEKGIIPNIPLPADYKERVPKFYKKGRKKIVEEYVDGLERMLARSKLTEAPEIRLRWDQNLGLTNISIGVHGGLDLNDDYLPHFQEHNLGGEYGFFAAFIAMQYVSELLKSK